MGRHLGSARNGVWGTSGDLELLCNEAVLSRERGPGIHNNSAINSCWPDSLRLLLIV